MIAAQAVGQGYRYSRYVMLGWYYLLVSSSSLVIFTFVDSKLLWVWLTLLGIGALPSFLIRKKIYRFSCHLLQRFFETMPTIAAFFLCLVIWAAISLAGFLLFGSYGWFYTIGSAIFLFLLFRDILTYAVAGIGS